MRFVAAANRIFNFFDFFLITDEYLLLIFKVLRVILNVEMEENKLLEQINQLRIDFLNYYTEVIEKQDIEDIHQLRVTIKKWRILTALIAEATAVEEELVDFIDPMRGLFKKAGEVREIQLNLRILLQLNTTALLTYNAYLHKIREKATRKLIVEMHKFNLTYFQKGVESLYGKVEEIDPAKMQSAIRTLVRKKLNKAQKLILKKDDPECLHKIRSNLKVAAELLNLLAGWKAEKELEIFLLQLKHIYHALGNWHDYHLLNQSIQQFFHAQKFKSKEQKKETKYWLKQIDNQVFTMKSELLNLLGDKEITNYFNW